MTADLLPVRRALLSVSDKTGLVELATALAARGVELLSTGGTAKAIRDAGLAVKDVAEVTGFPEMMDGRVKTLHPTVHGGLLGRSGLDDAVMAEHGIGAIDLLVLNLYPFESVTAQADCTLADAVENIDIGGPAMLRSAAKNFARVAVATDPSQYAELLASLEANNGQLTAATRFAFSVAAFNRVAQYDAAISNYLSAVTATDAAVPARAEYPAQMNSTFVKVMDLRYGENPHQSGAFYRDLYPVPGTLATFQQLQGKELSYNNLADADAAWECVRQFDAPACVIVKHANPCGVAVTDEGTDIAQAHAKAHACDPVSAFGGVIAANRPVTAAMAAQVKDVFTEVVVAPAFEPEALAILSAKKNLRLLSLPEGFLRDAVEAKQVSGGMLLQIADAVDADGDDPATWTLAAGPAADEAVLADLAFAWRAVRAAKSNAVLLAHDGATVGVGMGQVNRLDSCRLAVERANTLGAAQTGGQDVSSAGGAENVSGEGAPERARGSVAASDAFFPFADGLQILIDAGVKAVVQPGGSVRDEEVVAAAEAAGVTLYLTGARHFFHG